MKVLQKQESESNKANEKKVAESKGLGVTDLSATLNEIIVEKQELLRRTRLLTDNGDRTAKSGYNVNW